MSAAPLTDFDLALIAEAKKRCQVMIEGGARCCGTCRFAGPPADPNDAVYYITCNWATYTTLPSHLDVRRLQVLNPLLFGTSCEAWETKPLQGRSLEPAIGQPAG